MRLCRKIGDAIRKTLFTLVCVCPAFWQHASNFTNLVEDHKTTYAHWTYIDAESTFERLSNWVTTPEANNMLPPHDHVMLFTR